MIFGALSFSLIVGRYRARRLAKVADQLAHDGGEIGPPGKIGYPDGVLLKSFERLAARIAAVEAMATTDVLTGVLNRQATLKLLATEIERSNRYGRPLSIALFDLDHFKRVNDAHGHTVGDRLLAHIGALLKASIRSVDSLGRYGGEEFILIMPETDTDGAAATAEQLRRIVAGGPISVDGVALQITLSAGIAGGAGSPSLELTSLLNDADVALYTAKSLGRDQVHTYRPVDDEAAVPRAAIDATARSQAAQLGRIAFDAANQRLLRALSDRPGWAGGPSQLIAEIAAELARAVGLPDGDVERIRAASLLHDLGKLAIPDSILSKPGELTPAEWRTITEHPKIGQVVLEQAGAIRDAAEIVLHHHEWFDGRGYPYGLKETEIPLGSRIVAIADAYEAMIAGRPYKSSMTHAEAIAELRRGRGIQFDPELVELFVNLYGRSVPARSRSNGDVKVPARRR